MNSFGMLFKVTLYGTSHSNSMGVLIEGVRPGIKIRKEDFKEALAKRKPQKYGTTRIEDDKVNIISGIFNGYTTGDIINISLDNNNVISKDYENLKYHFRPSHADYVAYNKYKGFNDYRGGGQFSGRLTALLVIAGVVSKKIYDFNITSEIVKLGTSTNSLEFENILDNLKDDSIGGIVKITIKDLKDYLGEPFFDSLESLLAHGLFSVPAVKGVSFGAGFLGSSLLGSEFNDLIIDNQGKTSTNNNGGINGGIANLNDIIINVFVKPTPSIRKGQNTYNFKNDKLEELVIEGRHDKAIILRIGVVLESICQIVLTDLYLRNKVLYNE